MSLFDILFPKYCVYCKRKGNYLCKQCLGKSRLAKQICIECRRSSIDGLTHFKCKKPLSIDGMVSVWEYEKAVKKAILIIKYKFSFVLGQILADSLSFYLKTNITALPKKAILVPIPLHPSRKKWRGFNQSEEVGKIIANKMGWQYNDKILIRSKKTAPQAKLKSSDRKKNILGVFSVSFHIPSGICDVPIIVFDDITTTGSTIREAGKTLKKAGFKTVWGLTLAN